MYMTATVIQAAGTEALVLFPDQGIQKTAAVMDGVSASPGDTVYVLTQDGFSNCLVIGVKGE